MKVGLIQKIIGSLLALLLVLGIVPVGLFYFATPVVAEDSVVRLSPVDETFVYSGAKNKSRKRLDTENLIVGNYWNTYLKFDLTSLGNLKRADMRSAKLRLAVVDTGTNPSGIDDNTFNVSYIDNDNWNDGMTWSERPMGEEQYLCTAGGVGRDGILEIDLSEFLGETAGFEDKIITLKLSPSLSNTVPVRLGSGASPDSSYRPYLKVIVGDGEDRDPSDLKKSYLADNGYISKAEPGRRADKLTEENGGMLSVDNGSAAYLKFVLNLENIRGAVTGAEILLRPEKGSGGVNIKTEVYRLLNDDWKSETLTYDSRPREGMIPVCSLNGVSEEEGIRIDVTDQIYEAVGAGKSSVSFVVDGTGTTPESTDSLRLRSSYSESGAPELRITCTDEPAKVALGEAIGNLKGENESFDNVTRDLPSSYVASNGQKVEIKWNINKDFSLSSLLSLPGQIITGSGKINPPSEEEGPREIQVRVELNCGGETMTKFVLLTIPPSSEPPK